MAEGTSRCSETYEDTRPLKRHEATLSSLEPGNVYWYSLDAAGSPESAVPVRTQAGGAALAVAGMFLPGVVLMLGASAAVGRWEGDRRVRRAIAALRPITIGMVLASAAVVSHSAVTDTLTILVAIATAATLLLTRAPVLAILAAVAAVGLLAG
jgi:hypothetical protein